MINQEVPYIKSWLLFFLVATIGGGILGMVFGAVLGGILGAAGVSVGTIGIVSLIAGTVIGIPISFFTFRWSVGKYIVAPILKAAGQQPA